MLRPEYFGSKPALGCSLQVRGELAEVDMDSGCELPSGYSRFEAVVRTLWRQALE
jgi:hypothetical protein